jgi:NADPH:quinone reductase-like Zn-dependent oxidoreductase
MTGVAESATSRVGGQARMRCVVYNGHGGPEVVTVQDREAPRPGRFEVLIAPVFAGLNPADVLQREGRHPVPAGSPADVPGLEVAGTVVALGDAVSTHELGDRVFGLVGGGGLAQRVVAHEREVVRVPDVLDDTEAAGTPEAFVTAFDALFCQAGLGAGDTLLINGAGGGVGTAAVQLGAALGARVIASVRSDTVRPRVAALGVEALAVDDAFARVREFGGADVILELVGAPHMRSNLEALAPLGRIVVVAAKPGDDVTISLRDLMARRGRLLGTTLRTRPAEQKGALMQAFSKRVVPLLERSAVRPIVDRVFALDDAVQALDAVREPGKFGKLLLAVDPDGPATASSRAS